VTWVLLVVGSVVVYQFGVVLAMAVAWRNPIVPPRRTPASIGVAFDEVRFPTDHGRTLHGWWVPAGDGAPRPVVVLVHGWGRNAERMLPYVPMLHGLGFHLLAFDARHHGLSDADGHASMLKFSQDVRAAVDFAAVHAEVDPSRIAVLGLSVGGSAAIHAAAYDDRIRAVVTAGAFADPRDAMVTLGRWSWVFRPGLPLAFRFIEWRIGARLAAIAPEAVISRAAARVLIVHGEDDHIVPVDHARRLHRGGGKSELLLMAGRGHSDIHVDRGFSERLAAFLGAALDWPPAKT
jgi:pimeloyl-ACP methyl ester carboxylesterase